MTVIEAVTGVKELTLQLLLTKDFDNRHNLSNFFKLDIFINGNVEIFDWWQILQC